MGKPILFVEDGSVDVDELKKTLPEVPVIVYRQGSVKPEFKEVDTEVVINNTNKSPNEIKQAIFNAFMEISDKFCDPLTDGVRHKYIIDDLSINDFIDKVMEELTGADNVDDN